eukprot:c16616_g1_i1 orf=164-397(-)
MQKQVCVEHSNWSSLCKHGGHWMKNQPCRKYILGSQLSLSLLSLFRASRNISGLSFHALSSAPRSTNGISSCYKRHL